METTVNQTERLSLGVVELQLDSRQSSDQGLKLGRIIGNTTHELQGARYCQVTIQATIRFATKNHPLELELLLLGLPFCNHPNPIRNKPQTMSLLLGIPELMGSTLDAGVLVGLATAVVCTSNNTYENTKD